MGFLDFLFNKPEAPEQLIEYEYDENGIHTFPNGMKIAHISHSVPSVNAILEKSGYKNKLIYTNNEVASLSLGQKFKAFCGVYQLFTNKPLLLMIQDKAYPSQKQVEKILNWAKSLKSLQNWEIDSILNDCIESKTVCLEDFEDFSAKRVSEGRYIIDEYQFIFNNGILCKVKPVDGYNSYVKDFFVKNGVFDYYLRHASDYWGDNQENIVEEVNYQAECYAKIGKGILTDDYYQKKFRFPDGLIDYVSMALCYSSSDVEFEKFKIALHGNFKILRQLTDEEGKEVLEVSLPQYNERQLFVDGHSKTKEEIEAEDKIWDDFTQKLISGEIDADTLQAILDCD